MVEILSCAPPGLRPTELRLGASRDEVLAALQSPEAFVLADRRVAELLDAGALAAGERCLALPGGEDSKSFAALESVVRAMAAAGLDRGATLIALGGGTIGDLGGLAAALYLRGVRLVQVPTTLLAMLDSSVGGKTAINLPEGKNLVGQFWPAEVVVIHDGFLASLSEEDFVSGLGEALKVGIGLSAQLFELLEQRRDAVLRREPAVMLELIGLAARAKIAVVEDDPREVKGTRRLLNLGHTLGHALEAWSGWRIAHGRAVARGIWLALDVAAARGRIALDAADRARDLLGAYGFEKTELPPARELTPFLHRDKKAEDGGVHFVLPVGIGRSTTRRLDVAEIAALL